MKIDGPNKANLNAYNNQLKKLPDLKKDTNTKDLLEISSAAKKLQEDGQLNTKRVAYVQEIKSKVDSGEYKVNHEETAKKMMDFWSKK